MSSYDYPEYAYRTPPELKGGAPSGPYPVAIVGGGLVGLSMALDLAQKDVPVVLLDEENTVSAGSRAICQAKRTLEIWDRLGVAKRMMEKGVTWNEGRVYFGEKELYSFNLQDNPDSKFPAFINLQQYYVEHFLADACEAEDRIDLRWRNKVTAARNETDHVAVEIETEDGPYTLRCRYLIAADGARSAVRRALDLDFLGQVFEDHFLIADIRMKAPFPTERRFWFDPPFAPKQSALLHKQADDIWRLDFQLGWNIDRDEEIKPENVIPRVKRMLGDDIDFELEWVSIYTFQCRRLERFVHDRIIFAGDAAHQVSPFGARGGNSGVQDADNLGWKLAYILKGLASPRLLESYNDERVDAARESIRHSTRSTEFITPKGSVSRAFRDAVLDLAGDQPFARAFVNPGRLSTAATLTQSPLNSPDAGSMQSRILPGMSCPSLPVEPTYRTDREITHLLDALDGQSFVGLVFAETDDDMPSDIAKELKELESGFIPYTTMVISSLKGGGGRFPHLFDKRGAVAKAFDAEPGHFYLLRPDHHICARWPHVPAGQIRAALARATATETPHE